MSKYLVETYYTCTFKVNHYLDDINETELKNLEKRDDGKFEVLDVKLDNRKTKSLDPNNKKNDQNKKIDLVQTQSENKTTNVEKIVSQSFVKSDNPGKRFSMPDRRKGLFKKQLLVIIKFIYILVSMRTVKLEKSLLIQVKREN